MLKHCLIVALATLILLSACAGPRAESEEAKLQQELKKWESFDSQGVIEVSYMGLAMRKMFSLSKNQGQMRFDILEGGILGAGAQPLMSFYLGDYISFKSPYIPMLELLNVTDCLPVESLALFSSADSLTARYGAQIIKAKKLDINGVNISFSPEYKLDKVFDPKTKMELKPLYNSSGKLSELSLKGTDNLSMKFSFDKLEYSQPQIVALPKPKPNLLSEAFKGMEDLDLKALLKQFLQNKPAE